MNKLIRGLAALTVISLETTSVSAVSEAKKERQFSCTEDCTGVISCENLIKCKDPQNKCLVSGGILSKIKGRLDKVKASITEAEPRCKAEADKKTAADREALSAQIPEGKKVPGGKFTRPNADNLDAPVQEVGKTTAGSK